MSTVLKPLSPQSADVYRQLNAGQALTAKQLAEQLNILPNAVYRVASKLINLGMIEKVGGYPARFKALPAQAAMSFYLQSAAQTFRRELVGGNTQPQSAKGPVITLIKDRQHALKRSSVDARMAKESIDFIVSGLEVPDDTILAFRKATITGVPVRAIVQKKQETSKERLEKWHDIGVEVRYLPNLNMRLFVFDHRIVYLLSYDASNKDSAFGVRFDYAPLAMQMSQLFEQNWLRSKPTA